jgi:membrane protein implicated in regulation of membrane protease activity
MRLNVPERFSTKWWLWLGSGTFFFGLCTSAILYLLGIVTDPIPLFLVVIASSAIGDLLVAVSFELIAPTKVIVGPGERKRKDEELAETGTIVSGFDKSTEGRVTVRGEMWAARHYEGRELSLGSGNKVQVVGRDGLTLLVRPGP